jgi:hypothetical protein
VSICEKCGFDPDASVSAEYEFHIDRDPPSLNDRLFNAGPRARLYRKERDLWCWEFRVIRMNRGIPSAVRDERRRVTLVRVMTKRQKARDQDNLVGGAKLCVDALVTEKLIFDDDPHHAEIHYQQMRISAAINKPGLHVTIEVLQ